jgi:LCP family protein required for cell wall assembly
VRVEASRAGQTRRTRFGCGVAVLTALIVAVAGSVIAGAFFLFSSGSSQVAASFIHAQAGAVHWNTHLRLTVLLVGRKSDGPSAPAASLTVALFDPKANSVQLLSIPTDLWVTIPGYGPGRLGDALADAGIREQMLTVESVLRVPIPYYVVSSPQTVAQVTDTLGGLQLHLDTPMSLHGVRFRAGNRQLNGVEALAYAGGIAGDPQGSLSAMMRQQALLFALKRQTFTTQNFFRIPNIVNTIGGSVITNFPYDQVLGLVHMLNNVPRNRMTGDALSYANGSITGYDAQNGEVSLPNWHRIALLARRMILPGSSLGAGKVTVVNGTDVTGQAATLAAWLQGERVHVASYQTGPAAGYAKTRVVVARGANSGTLALARTVALLLQVPVATGPVPPRGPQIMVCIGRDYQDPTQQ